MLDEEVREYLRQIGTKGGRASGGAKAVSSRANGLKAKFSGCWDLRSTKSEKERCRYLSKVAIRHGTLVKLPCSQSGDVNSQMHHPDYTKPLEVMWLCRKCHYAEHMRLKAAKLDPRSAPQPGVDR